MKAGVGFKLVRPGGLELPTFWFVARRSIQLSYGRTVHKYYHRPAPSIQPSGKQTCRRIESMHSILPNANCSGRGFPNIRLCAAHKTPAVLFGAEPEQYCQCQNRHDFEARDRPLITEADVKRVLDRICGRCEQYPELIRQARHQPT